VTFEAILEAKRRSLAIRYLGVTRMSVKAAAYRLGFSDPAAFSRAFKRWTGTSPSEFRTA
jgi:AraC-like DNA-binding protein